MVSGIASGNCLECGAALAAGGICQNCAARTSSRSGPAPGGTSPASTPVPTKVKVGVIVASFILPLIGLALGFIYLRSGDPEKQKVARPWLFVSLGVFLVYGAGFCGKLLNAQQPVCYNAEQVAVKC